MVDETPNEFTTLTVQLLSAFVSNNTVPADGLADLIKSTRAALAANLVASEAEPEAIVSVPAVSIRRSIASRDFILSLIDGKPYKTLKRHLAHHGLTPDQYRDRFNLPRSYPMVAPAYSDARRAVAEKLGLGRKPAKIAKNGADGALPKDAASKINSVPSGMKDAAETVGVGAKAGKSAGAKTASKTTKMAAPETASAKPGKMEPSAVKKTSRNRLSMATPTDDKQAPAPKAGRKAETVSPGEEAETIKPKRTRKAPSSQKVATKAAKPKPAVPAVQASTAPVTESGELRQAVAGKA
ncbi:MULTISPECIES: MucR family transcriptional regulator [unclassified Sphingobium]|uniref:MucR family transcriptional regulator n=1 Tax=unclassified Sphingobium TaxID=2611147 RepID=UPI000D17B316|nr:MULTISPECIES: MucR family transcriptional regulator [unclassified Sphingobium]MBG6119868.1 putative transcriptional regulator [Sphingobium sp. JAI105]PSO10182.1 transcriptional regulator [Sphingobium sp. AEW4]TWC98968.1 MucR family transcriptional regulator [Sphingobium sp. AEW010]TWD18473.1 MucR family transcriptional regulator [Sphingobium sp. AEW013]TWD21255.1 MucR family transcriptional regulator [Sphingobium sp. AEW001]